MEKGYYIKKLHTILYIKFIFIIIQKNNYKIMFHKYITWGKKPSISRYLWL